MFNKNQFHTSAGTKIPKYLSLFLGLFMLGMVSCVSTVLLKNAGQDDTYIKVQNGQLSAGSIAIDQKSGLWEKEVVDANHFRLKKHGTSNQYLHIKNGVIECSTVPSSDHSAHWKLNNVDNSDKYKIENRSRSGHVLHVERGALIVGDAVMGEKSKWEVIDKNNLNDVVVGGSSDNLTAEQKKMVMDFMMKGYKGEENYADPKSIGMYPLFDPEVLTKYIIPQDIGSFDGRMFQGESIKKYSNDMSTSASVSGSYGLFSAGISASFSKNLTSNSDISFFTWNRVVADYRLDLDLENASKALLPTVRNDIANMNPDALFDKYGTHFIQSAYFGARISLNTHIKSTDISDNTNISVSVKAAYGAISGEAKYNDSTSTSDKEFTKNAEIKVIGGNSSLSLEFEHDKDKKSFDNWVVTIGKNKKLADFGDHGLRPISELAENEDRQKILFKAIGPYLLKNGVPFPEPQIRVKKNSIFKLVSADDRHVTRPIKKPIMEAYYPEAVDQDSIGKFRVSGLFTFNEFSSDLLKSNDNVSILFKEKELIPNWFKGEMDKESNADWYNKRHLKLGGNFGEVLFAHYADPDSWTSWNIIKVSGNNGDQIYSGDEVYLYAGAVNKYLNPSESGALWVDPKPTTGKNFVWKIIVIDPALVK